MAEANKSVVIRIESIEALSKLLDREQTFSKALLEEPEVHHFVKR